MTRPGYRCKIRMLMDIMQVIQHTEDGAIISSISREANLSHYAAMELVNPMLDATLIETDKVKQQKSGALSIAYTMTAKGKDLFRRLNMLSEELTDMKLQVL